MKKNIIEKFGKKICKNKENKKLIYKKYWKLPATERIHYDIIRDKIENDHIPFFALSYTYLKFSCILPIFFMFFGLMTNDLLSFTSIAQTSFITLLKFLPIILLVDIIYEPISLYISFSQIHKLNKKFKLIK